MLDYEPFMVVNLEKLASKDFEYLKKLSKNFLNVEEVRYFALGKNIHTSF
ncbi:hypothetical protein QIA00_04865 (plasmid) [Borreliella americana]|uniref:Uncharacterized protein n=2 Tax=Borreliella americana TaxID=478807 RepID=A0ACD5G6B8_9SPIR